MRLDSPTPWLQQVALTPFVACSALCDVISVVAEFRVQQVPLTPCVAYEATPMLSRRLLLATPWHGCSLKSVVHTYYYRHRSARAPLDTPCKAMDTPKRDNTTYRDKRQQACKERWSRIEPW